MAIWGIHRSGTWSRFSLGNVPVADIDNADYVQRLILDLGEKSHASASQPA